ncbi:MAG: OsmC family protein [Sulfolobales archaeon]
MEPYIVVDGYTYRFGVRASSLGDDLLTKVQTFEGHTLYVDEPKAVEGLGRAPNPIEMFLSSLASCFIITLKLHSRRFKTHIDLVEVLAEGSFDIRGFLLPQKFRSGFTSLSLNVKMRSKENCDNLIRLLERVTKGWVVGSTVSNALPIQLNLETTCVDAEGNMKELSLKELIKTTT